MMITDAMQEEVCNLAKIIPKDEIKRVFTESVTASAEIDITFLAFEDIYEMVLKNTTNDTIIIDLGCAYAPQCWYFKDYQKYIGIDLPSEDNIRFKTDNTEFYLMSIQDFIKDVLPTLNIDLNKCVAICSWVPDREAQELVRDTFPRHYIYYGNDKSMINDIQDINYNNTNCDYER